MIDFTLKIFKMIALCVFLLLALAVLSYFFFGVLSYIFLASVSLLLVGIFFYSDRIILSLLGAVEITESEHEAFFTYIHSAYFHHEKVKPDFYKVRTKDFYCGLFTSPLNSSCLISEECLMEIKEFEYEEFSNFLVLQNTKSNSLESFGILINLFWMKGISLFSSFFKKYDSIVMAFLIILSSPLIKFLSFMTKAAPNSYRSVVLSRFNEENSNISDFESMLQILAGNGKKVSINNDNLFMRIKHEVK